MFICRECWGVKRDGFSTTIYATCDLCNKETVCNDIAYGLVPSDILVRYRTVVRDELVCKLQAENARLKEKLVQKMKIICLLSIIGLCLSIIGLCLMGGCTKAQWERWNDPFATQREWENSRMMETFRIRAMEEEARDLKCSKPYLNIEKAIQNSEIKVGMSQREVFNLYGRPIGDSYTGDCINSSVGVWGVYEQVTYTRYQGPDYNRKYIYLYFDNYALTGWQD